MSFDQAAVNTLISNVVSHAMATGAFRSVNSHEPKAAPGSGLRCGVWADTIVPLGGASGMAATSGEIVLTVRVYGNMLTKPEDEIDPRILAAVSTLIGAYSGDFDFGDTVRNVDLLGAYGTRLSAQAGYVQIGGAMYRIMDISVPVIINDMWSQEA